MKFLLIFCLSFSVFATHHERKEKEFSEHKTKMLEKLKASETPNQEDIACVEKAENKKALKKCKKVINSRKSEKKKTEETKPKASVPETNQNEEERAEQPAQT